MACIQDTHIQAFFYHNIYRKMKIEIKHIASLEMEYWRKFDYYFQFIKFLKKILP